MVAHPSFDREQVTRIYLEAIELGLPPVRTLLSVLECSYPQARYMARAVKDEGFLGAHPHYPTRATIHRGSAHEQGFTVCEHCLNKWPCPGAYPFYSPYEENEPDDTGRRRRRRRHHGHDQSIHP